MYTHYFSKLKSFFMLSYIILFLIDSFYPIKLWTIILTPIIITLFLISFPKVKSFNKYLSIILVSSGVYLLSSSNSGLFDWLDAVVKNAGLTVLLLSVPLLSIIFLLEDFSSHISKFAEKRINSNFSFYIFSLLLTHFFGMILNVACFPMVKQLLSGISTNHSDKVFNKALTRGFCLAQLWAPNFVVMAIILQYSELEWHSYVPVGLGLASIGLAISVLLGKLYRRKTYSLNAGIESESPSKEGDIREILKVVSIGLLLTLFIIGFQYITGETILVAVPLAAVIFPIGLALLFGKMRIYKEGFKVYFNRTLPKMNNEIILFTSVGFFGHALGASGADQYIPLFIERTGITNPAILIPFMILLIFIISLVGFHPILSISAISIAYFAGAIPLTQLQLAAVFSVGYFSYTLLSPFSGMVLAIASLSKKSPIDIGVSINFVFWFLMIGISSVVINFL